VVFVQFAVASILGAGSVHQCCPGGGTRVTAQTWAAFPGIRGRLYRAMVIGSGGHRVVVRRMLRNIAAQADSHPVGSA
jgi:hypothetical protein